MPELPPSRPAGPILHSTISFRSRSQSSLGALWLQVSLAWACTYKDAEVGQHSGPPAPYTECDAEGAVLCNRLAAITVVRAHPGYISAGLHAAHCSCQTLKHCRAAGRHTGESHAHRLHSRAASERPSAEGATPQAPEVQPPLITMNGEDCGAREQAFDVKLEQQAPLHLELRVSGRRMVGHPPAPQGVSTESGLCPHCPPAGGRTASHRDGGASCHARLKVKTRLKVLVPSEPSWQQQHNRQQLHTQQAPAGIPQFSASTLPACT